MMFNKSKREKGVVLMATLLILIVLTVLGTSSMKTTVLEEKMSNNYGNRNLAFQAAEAGLREAENFLDLSVNIIDGNYSVGGVDSPGLYKVVPNTAPMWQQISDNDAWENNASTILFGLFGSRLGGLPTGDLPDIPTQPRYIIEESATCAGGSADLSTGIVPIFPCYFRTTSRGLGADGVSTVILQSVYKRY